MSDGTIDFPIRTTDPASPATNRIKLYNKSGIPYYIDENGLAKTLKGDAGLETLPLLQAKNTSSPLLTTAPADIPFETTQIETDSLTLNHDDIAREKLFAVISAYYFGALNMSFTNSTNGQREITVGVYLNGVTLLSSIIFKISANSDKLVTRTLFLPQVAANSYFTIKMSCDANSAVTFNAKSGVTLMGTKGVVGPSGVNGADGDITWQAAWVASDYVVNEAVTYLGSSYVCRVNTTAQQLPTDVGYWDVLASKGDIGLTGPAGSMAETNVTASSPVSYTPASGLILIDSMTVTPATGRQDLKFNSQYSSEATAVTDQAKTDLANLVIALEALTVTDATHGLSFGTETLLAGVYDITGAATGTAAATLTLDANNVADAIFVIRVSTTFTIGAGFIIDLINQANPSNVFFLITAGVTVAANSVLQGNLITKSTLSTATTCSILGRIASTTSALSPTALTVTKPAVKSIIDSDSFENFALFTSAGAVTNAGVSVINGDIGTNSGAVTGFTTSTVNGSIYTSVSRLSTLIFGIYLDNVLIANSDRVIIRTEDTLGDIINMYVMVDTLPGEVLDIKVEVLNGSITLGNRSITSLTVG